MKSFIAKRLNSILVNLRYLRFKLLKYKENNKNICNTFDHNFKNIHLYIMRKVSLERYYFVLYDCALTSKISKMALKSFCDKTLHIFPISLQTDQPRNPVKCRKRFLADNAVDRAGVWLAKIELKGRFPFSSSVFMQLGDDSDRCVA